MTIKTWIGLLRISIFLCILSLVVPMALAQIPAAGVNGEQGESKSPDVAITEVSHEFASPRDTISTFLLNAKQLVEDRKNRAAWRQVFRTFDVPETLGEQRRAMAAQLLGIFNSLGRIDVETMAPGIDEIKKNKLKRFEFFPDNPYPAANLLIEQAISDVGGEPTGEIVLIMTDSGEWKFSAETLTGLAQLWSWIEGRGAQYGVDVRELVPAQIIRTHLVPDILKGRFMLELELWQWAGLFVALFLAVLVDVLVRLVLRPIVRPMLFKTGEDVDTDMLRRVIRPFGLLAAVLVFWGALFLLAIVGVALLALVVVIKLVFAFASAWVAWSLTDLLAGVFMRRTEGTEAALDNMFVPLLRRAVKLLILAFALIYTSSALEVNILPLLGSLGLAGLAISFAAQDMVGNLFGGVTIFLDKPFKTGDRIIYQGYDGIIENIGFRSTKVRTLNGHLVTIPNGGLTGDAVENVSQRPTIKRVMNILIPLTTAPDKVEQAVQIIREILAEEGIRDPIHPLINGDLLEPKVYFNDINAESLNIFVIYWFAPPDYWDYMAHAHQVNLRITAALEKLRISFAIPTRKVHLEGGLHPQAMIGSTVLPKGEHIG
jgi:MscS family membrane protein